MRQQASYRHKVKDRIPKQQLKCKANRRRYVHEERPIVRFTFHPIFGLIWLTVSR